MWLPYSKRSQHCVPSLLRPKLITLNLAMLMTWKRCRTSGVCMSSHCNSMCLIACMCVCLYCVFLLCVDMLGVCVYIGHDSVCVSVCLFRNVLLQRRNDLQCNSKSLPRKPNIAKSYST